MDKIRQPCHLGSRPACRRPKRVVRPSSTMICSLNSKPPRSSHCQRSGVNTESSKGQNEAELSTARRRRTRRSSCVQTWGREWVAAPAGKTQAGSNSADMPSAGSGPWAGVVSTKRHLSRTRAALPHSSGVSGPMARAKPCKLASLQNDSFDQGASSCTPVRGSNDRIICNSEIRPSEKHPKAAACVVEQIIAKVQQCKRRA